MCVQIVTTLLFNNIVVTICTDLVFDGGLNFICWYCYKEKRYRVCGTPVGEEVLEVRDG